MRFLTLGFLFISFAVHAAEKPKIVRMIDRAADKMYNFKEVKGMQIASETGKDFDQVFASIKKQLNEMKERQKKERLAPLKGNPASSFCVERVKGKTLTFTDLEQAEFTICRLPDGSLVNAWDLFRYKN